MINGSLKITKRKLKKKNLETNDNKNMTIQNLWDTAKAVLKREVYSNTILYWEKRKISNNLALYLSSYRETNKTQS